MRSWHEIPDYTLHFDNLFDAANAPTLMFLLAGCPAPDLDVLPLNTLSHKIKMIMP